MKMIVDEVTIRTQMKDPIHNGIKKTYRYKFKGDQFSSYH